MPEAFTLAALRSGATTRPVVVLAIDDEHTCAMCAFAATVAGFDVTTADRDAVPDKDRLARPDIVVVDVSAGSRHGWTLVRTLKRDQRTADIPVVAMAADVCADTQERARREGCAAVCLKTCPAHHVVSGLRAVLNACR